jgi:hypothetical protein
VVEGVTFMPAPPKMRRFDDLCDELAERCGQQNVIAARISEILAEIDEDNHWGQTGVRSLEHLATWQLGVGSGRARKLCAVAPTPPPPPAEDAVREREPEPGAERQASTHVADDDTWVLPHPGDPPPVAARARASSPGVLRGAGV